MKLLLTISPQQLLRTYNDVKRLLAPHDQFIFDAMATVTRERVVPFTTASGPGEYGIKHREIERLLQGGTNVLDARGTMLHLMEQIVKDVESAGGVPNVPTDALVDTISFETKHGARIRLSREGRWIAEWHIPAGNNPRETTRIQLDIFDRTWEDIVPSYVVEFVACAANAYTLDMTAGAAALLAVATEATLRDVLRPCGYHFIQGGASADTFKSAPADLTEDGGRYALTFRNTMPKEPADFRASAGGTAPVEVHVRRKVGRRGRTDIVLRVPPEIIDHLSLDVVEQPAPKKVNGLGEALRVARYTLNILKPQDLPPDLDQVLTGVRNNLVHLSGDALSQTIPGIADPQMPGIPVTLERFLSSPLFVHDLFLSVPMFINEQYLLLRAQGHSA